MIKILHYIHGLNIGGAESFIYNILQLNKAEYHFDLAIQSKINKNRKLINECKNYNCKIYQIADCRINPQKCYDNLVELLKKGEYQYIHIHANSLVNITPLLAAQKFDIGIILHSHSSINNNGGVVGNIVHRLGRRYITRIPVIRLACSKEAGIWMFKSKPFRIVSNAIRIGEYRFDEKKRDRIRKKLNIKNKFVIVHVGRFVKAKNHQFLLKCYNKIKNRMNGQTFLILIGDGPLRKKIQDTVNREGDSDSVFFAGNIQNVSDYYSAADCMIFPSLYEGLPFVIIEAQASGLPIYSSTNISRSIDITKNISFYSLSKGEDYWANKIVEDYQNSNCNRTDFSSYLKGTVYDSRELCKEMESIYNLH